MQGPTFGHPVRTDSMVPFSSWRKDPSKIEWIPKKTKKGWFPEINEWKSTKFYVRGWNLTQLYPSELCFFNLRGELPVWMRGYGSPESIMGFLKRWTDEDFGECVEKWEAYIWHVGIPKLGVSPLKDLHNESSMLEKSLARRPVLLAIDDLI